jgi:hypothetical protein
MRRTNAEIIDTARRIVTGDLMVADLSDRDWQMSLALILSGLTRREAERIGLILVPFHKHAGSRWLNGRVPGCTFSVELVHVNDMVRLDAEVKRMFKALHPEIEDDAYAASEGSPS